MTPLVVDASVGLKWYFEEPWSDAARELLSGNRRLIVPRLFFLEASNILRKRYERKELTEEDVCTTADSLDGLPLEVWPDHPLLRLSPEIAPDVRLTMFDAVYVALAVRLQKRVVTADRRLMNALQCGPFAAHVCWVAEVDARG